MTLPKTEPSAEHIPVPHPVVTRIVTVGSARQELTDEQRDRVCTWLRANDLDPKVVKECSIEYRDYPNGTNAFICVTQYFEDSDGHKELNLKTKEAVTFERYLPQKVELEPEPSKE